MEVKNLGQAFRRSCQTEGAKTALFIPEKTGYRTVSYSDLWAIVRGYAAVVLSLGLRKGDRIALQSESCPEWAYLDWACLCSGVTLVPIYPTLPRDQAEYIAKDCQAKVIVAGSKELAPKTEGIAATAHYILKGEDNSIASMAQTATLDDRQFNELIDSVSEDDLATIIYTSGTTGLPKGVMLPHRAPVFTCEQVDENIPITRDDRFFSFLPMSHVFERIVGHILPIFLGAQIAYAKSLASLANDIVAAEPTIILCVPRFLESIRDRIVDSTKSMPPIRKRLFQMALAQGVARAQGKFAPLSFILDKLVGVKIRDRLGGRIRYLVSGGAALAPAVAEFYMAFRLEILQGYGLTETTAGTCLNHPDRNRYWTVGEPIGKIEVKIAEDGEICIRGDSVMTGYWNLPEETAKAIDEEGWFHSGDIGVWEGKSIKITDRKKDLLVLANGKNVAPQPIENKLKESEYIQEAVLFGDGKEYCAALLIPNFERVGAYLKENDVTVGSNSEILEHPLTRDLFKQEVSTINKSLADFERVKKYELIEATFSVETGELTPSLKVKRKVVRERFENVIAGMFG